MRKPRQVASIAEVRVRQEIDWGHRPNTGAEKRLQQLVSLVQARHRMSIGEAESLGDTGVTDSAVDGVEP